MEQEKKKSEACWTFTDFGWKDSTELERYGLLSVRWVNKKWPLRSDWKSVEVSFYPHVCCPDGSCTIMSIKGGVVGVDRIEIDADILTKFRSIYTSDTLYQLWSAYNSDSEERRALLHSYNTLAPDLARAITKHLMTYIQEDADWKRACTPYEEEKDMQGDENGRN